MQVLRKLIEWFLIGVAIGYVAHMAIETYKVIEPSPQEAVREMMR